MGTLRPRIGVTKDPDLAAALDRQRLLERPDVRPATRAIDVLPWLEADPVDEDRRASRTLEWVRGER